MDSTMLNLMGIEQGANGLVNALSDISESNFVAKQFEFNEQIASIQGQEAITQGQEEQQVSQERTAQLSGQQQAAEAAQGADVHTGTAAITREQTGEIGALDYLTIGNNAFLKSIGYQIEGENDKTQAGLATSAGWDKAGNSLLSGAEMFEQNHIKAVAYDQPGTLASGESAQVDTTQPDYSSLDWSNK